MGGWWGWGGAAPAGSAPPRGGPRPPTLWGLGFERKTRVRFERCKQRHCARDGCKVHAPRIRQILPQCEKPGLKTHTPRQLWACFSAFLTCASARTEAKARLASRARKLVSPCVALVALARVAADRVDTVGVGRAGGGAGGAALVKVHADGAAGDKGGR